MTTPDPAAVVAAIIARLAPFIGRFASFPLADGTRITGTLSAVDLRESDGGVWATFREYPEPFLVLGGPDEPPLLPGARQVEKGPQ